MNIIGYKDGKAIYLSTGINYLDSEAVEDHRITYLPTKGQTVSGYGKAIPTMHMLKVRNRWYRVKVTIYSNNGTAYITVCGIDHIVRDDCLSND